MKWASMFALVLLVAAGTYASAEAKRHWDKLPSEQSIRLFIDQAYSVDSGKKVYIADVPPHIVSAILAAEQTDYLNNEHAWAQCAWRTAKHFFGAKFERCDLHFLTFAAGIALTGTRASIVPARATERVLMAWKLEILLSREEIVELVLNHAYFGSGAIGLTAAAQEFYGKSVVDISISQAATLAGLLKAPNSYNPHRNALRAKSRRNNVLSRMHEREMITTEQWSLAVSNDINR